MVVRQNAADQQVKYGVYVSNRLSRAQSHLLNASAGRRPSEVSGDFKPMATWKGILNGQ